MGVLSTLLPKMVFSDTIKVSDSESIQIAIRDAKDGDVIELPGGKFAGRVSITKSLPIRGVG